MLAQKSNIFNEIVNFNPNILNDIVNFSRKEQVVH